MAKKSAKLGKNRTKRGRPRKEVFLQVSQREYDSWLAQIEHWQGMFEREQRRADALVDQVLVEGGRAPVSHVENRAGTVDMQKAAREMFEQMNVAMSDGDGSDFIDENDMVRIAPDAVAALGGK